MSDAWKEAYEKFLVEYNVEQEKRISAKIQLVSNLLRSNRNPKSKEIRKTKRKRKTN